MKDTDLTFFGIPIMTSEHVTRPLIVSICKRCNAILDTSGQYLQQHGPTCAVCGYPWEHDDGSHDNLFFAARPASVDPLGQPKADGEPR